MVSSLMLKILSEYAFVFVILVLALLLSSTTMSCAKLYTHLGHILTSELSDSSDTCQSAVVKDLNRKAIYFVPLIPS